MRRVSARSQQDRIAALPIPEGQLVDGLAAAIYMTHRRDPAPIWENLSDASREWMRDQAREALAYLRALNRPFR